MGSQGGDSQGTGQCVDIEQGQGQGVEQGVGYLLLLLLRVRSGKPDMTRPGNDKAPIGLGIISIVFIVNGSQELSLVLDYLAPGLALPTPNQTEPN